MRGAVAFLLLISLLKMLYVTYYYVNRSWMLFQGNLKAGI